MTNIRPVHILAMIAIYVIVSIHGINVKVIRSNEDFPLPDCLSEDIDLLFVADAAVGEEAEKIFNVNADYSSDNNIENNAILNNDNVLVSQTFDEYVLINAEEQVAFRSRYSIRSDIYRQQMYLFSRLIDVFTSPAETTLNRVRVALSVSVGGRSSEPMSSQVVQRFSFREHTEKAKVKRVLEEDNTKPVANSYPLSAARYVIENFNNIGLGARRQSQHVAIIAVGRFVKIDIDLIEDLTFQLFNNTNIRIFFVLMDSKFMKSITSVFPRNNVLHVGTSDSDIWKQTIPMALCSKCNSDWLPFRYSRGIEMRLGTASCFRHLSAEDHINWLDAVERCATVESLPASLESQEELISLRLTLLSKMCSLAHTPNIVGALNNDSTKYVDIYIGLRRETKSFRKHFRWHTKSPLVYSYWAQGEPSGGYGKACVVWRFYKSKGYISRTKMSTSKGDNLEMNETLSQKKEMGSDNSSVVSEHDDDSQCFIPNDGWYTVPCGHRMSRFYLCEQSLNLFEKTIEMSVTEKPSSESVQSAIDRAEIAFADNTDQSFSLVSAVNLLDYYMANYERSRMSFRNHNSGAKVPAKDLVSFHCDSLQSIPYTFVCDLSEDCRNKNDEAMCQYPSCMDHKRKLFKCKSKHCVPRESVCDLFPDCPDQSDELDCMSCGQGLCPDGSCLPTHWFADGEVDCNANTFNNIEEEMASTRNSKIQDCVVTCNRTKCVSPLKMGDGILDCQGPEGPIDETIGSLESASCYTTKMPEKYNNWAPKCVYIKDRFGGIIGCKNMAHLQDCHNFTCPPEYIKCPGSYCIPIHYMHNQEPDCPFGEDEDSLVFDCSGGYYKCANTKICLHPSRICDNHSDCPRGDDELSCHVTCGHGFLCLTGAVIAQGYNKSEPLIDLRFIDYRTRYLDLSGIDLSLIFSQFMTALYENMYFINVSNSRIKTVEPMFNFDIYSQPIVYLDMSGNLIKEIKETSWLRTLTNLRELNLSKNIFLERIHEDAFNAGYKSVLKYLDLSYTKITSISFKHFRFLQKLSYLNLRGTMISVLRSDMFPKGFILEVLDVRDISIETIQMNSFLNVTILSNLFTDSFKVCCPQIHNPKTKMGTCQAPEDAFSSCSDLMYETVLRLILWVNGILAVFGNFIVIVYRVFYDQTVLRMAYGHFVTHLGIADFIMGVYLVIIALADVRYRGTYAWNEAEWRNSIVCKLAGFSSTVAAETSAIFIFLITVDRFLVVKFPLGQFRMSNRVMKFCCALTWLLGIVVGLIPLLPLCKHWKMYSSNGMCLGLPLMTTKQPGWQYSFSVFIVVDFILFSLICFGQVAIYKTMTSVSTDTGLQTSHYILRRTHDFRVARNLSLIAVTDFMCWFPVCVTGLLALTGYDIGVDTYRWLAVLVLPVNASINPIIYTIPALKRRWTERNNKFSKTTISLNNSRG